MKKEKKQKNIVEEVVLDKKIKDVKINEKQHFLLFVSMLILFILLLVVSVWYVLINLTDWYYWFICLIILGLSFWLSLRTYIEIKHFHRCELYNNAISITSIWFNIKVALKDIYEINVKETLLDRIFKLNTKSLEVKILGQRRKKFTIHFVEENTVNLKQEIIMLIDKSLSNNENNSNDKFEEN